MNGCIPETAETNRDRRQGCNEDGDEEEAVNLSGYRLLTKSLVPYPIPPTRSVISVSAVPPLIWGNDCKQTSAHLSPPSVRFDGGAAESAAVENVSQILVIVAAVLMVIGFVIHWNHSFAVSGKISE